MRSLSAFAVILALGQGITAERVEGKLNVHLVCHTHDDAGWLKVRPEYPLITLKSGPRLFLSILPHNSTPLLNGVATVGD